MPSNDERREVARKLRDFETLREVFKESSICAFLHVFNDGYMDWEHVCVRLADLIEPDERTCRNTSEAVVKGPFTCSACGEHSKTWYHMGFGDMYADVPNYCPNCGARVVKEDAE